jgi:DNA/RNA-binding domain of Phe-tRNA-synthetase-like protein
LRQRRPARAGPRVLSATIGRVIRVQPHPALEVAAFESHYPAPLEATAIPSLLGSFLRGDAVAPLGTDEAVRKAVRDLLRHGGYKPTGRGKPASEYLLGALVDGAFPSINPAVDACNAVSLHSGLPISVVDLDRARAPFSIGIPAAGSSYVFNAAGQTIDVGGLLCLYDAEGPCANAVKDAQRTKTSGATTRTLSVVWGTNALPGRAAAAARWYRQLVTACGARTVDVEIERGAGSRDP